VAARLRAATRQSGFRVEATCIRARPSSSARRAGGRWRASRSSWPAASTARGTARRRSRARCPACTSD